MSHQQQQDFCKLVNKYFFPDKEISILEIGSYNVNGTIRSIFTNSKKFIGVDVVNGPCVDVVYDGLNLNILDHFDLSISCECFEHNPYYLENFKKMTELTKNDGVVVFTCASIFRNEHGTTRTTLSDSPGSMMKWDYYRNLFKKDFTKINLSKFFYKYQFYYNLGSHDLYFIGIKSKNFLYEFKLFNSEISKQKKISNYPVSLSLIFRLLKKYIKLGLNIISVK